MSKYTTGEIAKLCGVSVRTVQYYDTRNILVPSELSEGGRRLYSEEDLKRMKIICFLREAGIPINGINQLFQEENPHKVIAVLLDEQETNLRQELAETQKKLTITETMKRELREIENFSVESIGDIAQIMQQKNKLYQMRAFVVALGLPWVILQWVTLVYGFIQSVWWPFFGCCAIGAAIGVYIGVHYFTHTAYICPECHHLFRPKFTESFFCVSHP
jgi:DNA-binding transcriptional MerR regulator